MSRVEHLLRTEAPQVLGALVRRFGHFDIAEDAVQEALLAAEPGVAGRRRAGEPAQLADPDRVPADGRPAPHRPGPTPPRAARRHERAGDAGRRPDGRPPPETDDSLTLLLLCCHPALSPTSQVALTLRAVGGLTTAEIAHAYRYTEAPWAPGSAAPSSDWPAPAPGSPRRPTPTATSRMNAVMQVLYLIFNEGYTASTGDELARVDLTREAIRLTRMLHATPCPTTPR